MFISLILLALLCLYKSKVCVGKNNGVYFKDYMSFEKTTSIKGVFILLVFISHAAGYLTAVTPMDNAYMEVQKYLGQTVVTMFLLYSGYGVMESEKRKGYDYIKKFPKNRVLKVLVHFDIAVVIYLMLGLLMGKTYTLSKILLALIGLKSVGNSNWFIFDILCAYLLTYIAFTLSKKNRIIAAVVNTVLVVGFIIIMYKTEMPTRFYNTILCYPLGMWFSIFKDKFEKIVTKNRLIYIICLLATCLAFIGCRWKIYSIETKDLQIIAWIITNLVFSVFYIVGTMGISVNNKILYWFGQHLFPIFIFMRIPMEIMKHYEFLDNQYLFIIISFVATVILAYAFQQLFNVIDKKLFKK